MRGVLGPTTQVGTVLMWYGRLPPPSGWRLADGSRVYRRHDPVLYRLLRREFRARWLRWRVYLPDLREAPVPVRDLTLDGGRDSWKPLPKECHYIIKVRP